MSFAAAWAWLVAHQTFACGLLYVVLNVIPRPNAVLMRPGARRTLLLLLDRLCVLSAAGMPGAWKALFSLSQFQAPPPPDPEAPSKTNEDKPAAAIYAAAKAEPEAGSLPKSEDPK